MITRISSGSCPAGAVYYNEQKVDKGEAERLAVRNYEGIRLAAQHLTGSMVAEKLVDRASLNERIKLPTFHVSLALAKGERLPTADLLSIADHYMQQMGYGRQPYAVYQHHDTEHPHVHIVSVRVDEKGKKVCDKFEREKSNKIRQQIEKEFGLQIAEQAKLRPDRAVLTPVEYGKCDLKADLSAVVQGILKEFSFTSFSQYNQLLKIYNVQAIEIPMDGQKSGLKYTAIDASGSPVGASMKASSLAHRPTREVVERRIGAGKKIKGDKIAPLRKMVETQRSESRNWIDYQQRLSRIGVEVIPHLGKENNLFGISYLDTKGRILYTGSELGKAYTAGSLKTQLGSFECAPPVQKVALAQQVDQSHNYSWAEDSWEASQRRIELEIFAREHHYRKPTAEEKQEDARLSKEWGKQNREEWKQEQRQQPDQPTGEVDSHTVLMRRLLHALTDDASLNESEYELKKMLKKSHKPRLS